MLAPLPTCLPWGDLISRGPKPFNCCLLGGSWRPQHGYWRVWQACEGPSWGQQAYGESTVWVLLTSSSFRLQVDPTWWFQEGQNHAPTISVTTTSSSSTTTTGPQGGGRGDHDHVGGEGGAEQRCTMYECIYVFTCIYIYTCICMYLLYVYPSCFEI